MLCEALSVAREEKHKEIESPNLLHSLCCSAVLQLQLLLLGSSKGWLIVNICVQTSFHNTTCHQWVFFYFITFCQQKYWLFKTLHFEEIVVIVAVDKQVNEDVTKMPFH